jgi:hypothetical protein
MLRNGDAVRRLLLKSVKDVDVVVDVNVIDAAISITVVAFDKLDARAIWLGVDMSQSVLCQKETVTEFTPNVIGHFD